MIKFFRKIRQNLITENKSAPQSGRYLLYAIGEIILVVIGILIALSINNWNTQKIQNANTLKLSTRLLAETERNIITFDKDITEVSGFKNAALVLLKLMTEDYEAIDVRTVDSLVSNLLTAHTVNFNSAVLSEALANGEISSFKNDSLKNIVYSLPTQIESIRGHEGIIKSVSGKLQDFLFDKFSLRKMDFKFSPNAKLLGQSSLPETDNRKILSNLQFENISNEKYFLYSGLVIKYEAFNKKLKTLSQLLQQQIDENNK